MDKMKSNQTATHVIAVDETKFSVKNRVREINILKIYLI
jgi:hypothetical protein